MFPRRRRMVHDNDVADEKPLAPASGFGDGA